MKIANALVVLAGLYLIGLGIASLVRPVVTKRFLEGFASSAVVHFGEMAARIVVGIGMVLSAAQMRFTSAFFACGWILVGTSALLLLVPWRQHQRFAAWTVPMVTKRLTVFAFGSLLSGGLLLYALLAPSGAG